MSLGSLRLVFAPLKRDEGIHFLAIPVNAEIAAAYTPTRLSGGGLSRAGAQDKPVETIAVGNVLAVAELRQMPERYRNVANFVDMFFTGFQSLLEPGHHPKWNEVNLAAELPGWRRYAPADQWLQRNMQIAKAPSPEMLRTMFSRFLDERRQAIGRRSHDGARKGRLVSAVPIVADGNRPGDWRVWTRCRLTAGMPGA